MSAESEDEENLTTVIRVADAVLLMDGREEIAIADEGLTRQGRIADSR
jgi:hypothetical protein